LHDLHAIGEADSSAATRRTRTTIPSAPIIRFGEGGARDLGYPSTVGFEDVTLLTVWYEKLPGTLNAVLRLARWRLD
jgi:hypothetical protein